LIHKQKLRLKLGPGLRKLKPKINKLKPRQELKLKPKLGKRPSTKDLLGPGQRMTKPGRIVKGILRRGLGVFFIKEPIFSSIRVQSVSAAKSWIYAWPFTHGHGTQ
jgi:hypothetical protein